MQEEFEKKIRERMHTFGIQPAHQVWDEVDAALNRQKHRRFFVGWWILLGLAVLGGAILLLDKDGINNDKLNQQPIIISDTANNNKFAEKPKNPDTKDNLSTQNSNNQEAQKLSTVQSNNKSSNAINGEPDKTLGSTHSAVALKDKGSFVFNSHTSQIGNNPTGVTGDKDDVATASPQDGTKTLSTDSIKDSTSYNKSPQQTALLNKDADSAITPPKQQQDTVTAIAQLDKTDNKNTPPQTTAKTIATQKSKWFLTFSAGTTQTISQGLFNTATNALSSASPAAYYANVPAITALAAYKYNLAQPGLGFHISAGGLYERQLSPHWNVFGGIAIAYLSNTQQTGEQYKSASNIVSGNTGLNLSQPEISLQSYYQSGSTSTVVNKAWQANVPIGVGYVFNPKSKTKFMLSGGLSFAWLFNSTWLIPDARYDKLYYSKTVFNNTSVNWQIGPSIEFKNQWRFGLQYQQSFTTLAKSYVTPKLYWQNISIYTAIPLGRGKKHK